MITQDPPFTIPASLMQRVIDYLAKRPYDEVHKLIHAILAHNPKPEPPADGDAEKPPA